MDFGRFGRGLSGCVLQIFGNYPILAILAISSVALCLRPSARPPPPIELIVANKGLTSIRLSGHRAVEAPFFSFYWVPIWLVALLSKTVQIPLFLTGRKYVSVKAPETAG
jgi:hypothetical protein